MAELKQKNRVKAKELNLSALNMTTFPIQKFASMGTKLTHLDLSNNKITYTRNVFSLLPNLLHLDLSDNRIKKIDSDIDLLKNLIHLSFANNMIKYLPKSMISLKRLKYLNLSNNPLESNFAGAIGPSKSYSQCQFAAINAIQYLKDLRKLDGKMNKNDKKRIKSLTNNVYNANSGPTNILTNMRHNISKVFISVSRPTLYVLLGMVVILLYIYFL